MSFTILAHATFVVDFFSLSQLTCLIVIIMSNQATDYCDKMILCNILKYLNNFRTRKMQLNRIFYIQNNLILNRREFENTYAEYIVYKLLRNVIVRKLYEGKSSSVNIFLRFQLILLLRTFIVKSHDCASTLALSSLNLWFDLLTFARYHLLTRNFPPRT